MVEFAQPAWNYGAARLGRILGPFCSVCFSSDSDLCRAERSQKRFVAALD